MSNYKSKYEVIEYILGNYDYKDKADLMSLCDEMIKVAAKRDDVTPNVLNAMKEAVIQLSTLEKSDIDMIKSYLNTEED